MSAKDQDRSSAVSDAMSVAISAQTGGSATLAEGDNAKQTFIKSTINVVGGDQILQNKAVRDIISTEGEASDVHEGVWPTKDNDSLKNIRGDDDEILKRPSTSLETDQGSAKSAKVAEGQIAQTFENSSVNVIAGNQIIQHHHHANGAEHSTPNKGSATLAEGENVNQSFINSTLNVKTGDQIHGHTTVCDNTSAEGAASTTYQGSSRSAILAGAKYVTQTFINSPVNVVVGDRISNHHHEAAVNELSPQNQDISYRNLIRICNDNTKKSTAIDILDDFRHEELQLPDFEVYPQMRQVDVIDYYKGRYGHNQLTHEVGFLRKDAIEAKDIEIDDVVASMWRKKKSDSLETVGVIAIVASAGSGKSTLTRRIARRALDTSSKIEHVEDLPPYGERMVHYIELKDVVEKGDIKPSKFLFGGLFEYEFEEDQAFKWLDKYQSEAVIIFDGLDQARWDFEEKNLRKIKNHDRASCWTVMYNILSRNILRHVNVYVASREFKVSELPAMARPKTIITLNGLTFEDAHRLFAFLLKENGEELWQKLEIMSPRLINLVSVPVFLILTAVVIGRDPTKPPPTTVTQLYNRIISALQSVENIRNRQQILSIVDKLKALAFVGMKKGQVVFKKTDLKKFGVSAEEVQDLMTKVPGNNLLSRHLMQGNFTFFFCHQSLQEYLAAIFIAEMEINKFSRFDEEHLHLERWSVVRRFLAGVVFSTSQNDFYEVTDGTEKKQILSQSLRRQPVKNEWNNNRMEVLTAIYESDDDDLMKELGVIDVEAISLSRDEAHIVGTLTARSRGLRSLSLVSCRMDDELLGIVTRCITNPIHVKDVYLYNNKFSATALRSFLGHRRIDSLSGNLDWEVVKLPAVSGFGLKNGEDVIEITDDVSGHFNIKKSTLSFDHVYRVADIGFLGILFDAEFIEFDEQRQLLAKQDDLRQLSDCKLEKISKILLDCTEEEDINWSLIETSRKKYQMEVLEIAVNGQISVEDYNRHLNRAREISAFGSIHAMFYLREEDEFRNIVEACVQKKIECIRCIFAFGCRASVDDVSSLISNSNVKKVTLMYGSEAEMLKGEELKKAQKIANDVDTELEILKLLRETDAWQRLDVEFFNKENWKRQKMKRQ